MNKGNLKMRGIATIREINPKTGTVISEEKKQNIVTDAGAEAVVDYLADNAVDAFEFMAIGSGTTSVDESDTALEDEEDRSGAITPSTSGKTITWEHTFSSGAGKSAITEMGMLNASSNGTLFNHLTFTAKDNENNDLNITYDLTVS